MDISLLNFDSKMFRHRFCTPHAPLYMTVVCKIQDIILKVDFWVFGFLFLFFSVCMILQVTGKH